jgi:hypothetical protein
MRLTSLEKVSVNEFIYALDNGRRNQRLIEPAGEQTLPNYHWLADSNFFTGSGEATPFSLACASRCK